MSMENIFQPPQAPNPEDNEVSEHQERGINYLRQLLDDQEYLDGHVDVATNEEKKGLASASEKPSKKAKDVIKALIEEAARQILGEPDIISAKKRGKEFGQALRSVEVVSHEGQECSIEKGQSPELEELLREAALPEFADEIAAAQQDLDGAREREAAALETIKADFASRQNDPELLAAMDVWGMSPDSDNDWGEDNQGYHAGIVHYFEYRKHLEKAGRYKKEKREFGLQSYIDEAMELKGLLDNPTEDNEDIERVAFIKDDEGQARLMILTTEGNRVICFQKSGEPMRVVSVIPGGNPKNFEKMVGQELSPSENAKPRLNDLGANRELVN